MPSPRSTTTAGHTAHLPTDPHLRPPTGRDLLPGTYEGEITSARYWVQAYDLSVNALITYVVTEGDSAGREHIECLKLGTNPRDAGGRPVGDRDVWVGYDGEGYSDGWQTFTERLDKVGESVPRGASGSLEGLLGEPVTFRVAWDGTYHHPYDGAHVAEVTMKASSPWRAPPSHA